MKKICWHIVLALKIPCIDPGRGTWGALPSIAPPYVHPSHIWRFRGGLLGVNFFIQKLRFQKVTPGGWERFSLGGVIFSWSGAVDFSPGYVGFWGRGRKSGVYHRKFYRR